MKREKDLDEGEEEWGRVEWKEENGVWMEGVGRSGDAKEGRTANEGRVEWNGGSVFRDSSSETSDPGPSLIGGFPLYVR